jgi:hypothetical protein
MNHRIVTSERSRSATSPIGDRRQGSKRSLRVAAEWSRTTGLDKLDSLRPRLQILVTAFPAPALSFSHRGARQPRLRFSGTRKHLDRKHFSIDPIFWRLFVRSSFASLTNPQRHSRSCPKSRLLSLLAYTPGSAFAPLSRQAHKNVHSFEPHILDWLLSLVLPIEVLGFIYGRPLDFPFVYDFMSIWSTIQVLRVLTSYEGLPP